MNMCHPIGNAISTKLFVIPAADLLEEHKGCRLLAQISMPMDNVSLRISADYMLSHTIG